MTILNTDTGTVKFGVGQLTKATPKWATNIFRIVLYLSGAWAIIQHLDLGLSKDIIAKANEWAVAAPVLVHFTTRFFGLEQISNSFTDFDPTKVGQ